MSSTRSVAPRLVSWLLLAFGLAEVPWVVYLMFNQDPTLDAYHVRLVSLGLGLGSSITAMAAAWTVWRGARSAAMWCLAAATTLLFLAIVVSLSPSLQADGLLGDWVSLVLGIVGGIAALVAARWTLSEGQAPSVMARRVVVLLMAVVGVIILIRTGFHVATTETIVPAEGMRAVVVILDAGESIGLIGAGWASLRGARRATLGFAVLAASLLIIDAFTNVVAAQPGQAFIAALFYLVVGEIPSIVLAVIAARAAVRALAGADAMQPTAHPSTA